MPWEKSRGRKFLEETQEAEYERGSHHLKNYEDHRILTIRPYLQTHVLQNILNTLEEPQINFIVSFDTSFMIFGCCRNSPKVHISTERTISNTKKGECPWLGYLTVPVQRVPTLCIPGFFRGMNSVHWPAPSLWNKLVFSDELCFNFYFLIHSLFMVLFDPPQVSPLLRGSTIKTWVLSFQRNLRNSEKQIWIPC